MDYGVRHGDLSADATSFEAAMSHSRVRHSHGERSGKTILVVDDDPGNTDNLPLLLRDQGHVVHVAQSAENAFDILTAHVLPDLILLNLLMPGMTGWEFRERQRQDARLAPIPVVILSAVGEMAEWQDSLGDVSYLQKPIDPDKLNGVIRRFTVSRRPLVLVVDDEAGVRKMLDVVLRQYGFDVCTADGGSDGVEVYEQYHADIDIMLLDVQMPGLDGPQTLDALRAVNRGVRACFMSGHTGRYSAEDLLDMGGWFVLPKPFVSIALLAQTLWSMIGTKPVGLTQLS